MAFVTVRNIARFPQAKDCLGEEHPVRVAGIDRSPDLLDDRMGLSKIFAIGASRSMR